VIPINSYAPIDIENDHFKGRVCVTHDTGNEVGLESADEGDEDEPNQPKKGVQLQLQGKFKQASSKGADTSSGLYVGGELMSQLKLGWVMTKVMNLATGYVKKKTEGRFHYVQGDAKTNAQLSFPIAQLFTIIETPEGQDPPRLQSQMLSEVKWQGPARLDVNTTSTYTMLYKTPFLDCCSWELLNVPGVSPMGLERFLGEIISSDVVLYDLGVAGSHANWRKGAVVHWFFTRRQPGEGWLEDDGPSNGEVLDEGSDPSEASDAEEQHLDDDDELMIAGDDDASSSDSSSDGLVEDDEDEISRAESQALVDTWQMRTAEGALQDADNVQISVPFYIETIDRRRRRKLRVWYVFELLDSSSKCFWTAKNLHELTSLCRPRPRLRAFRRRHGATRGCQCYGVQTLEQFRQVVRSNLGDSGKSKIKRIVISSASADMSPPQQEDVLQKDSTDVSAGKGGGLDASSGGPQDSRRDEEGLARQSSPLSGESSLPADAGTGTPGTSKDLQPVQVEKDQVENRNFKDVAKEKLKSLPQEVKHKAEDLKDNMKQRAESAKDKVKTKAGDAASKLKDKVRSARRRGPLLPPPFFRSSGSSACSIAFANAKDGLKSVVHEGLVGVVHFEGRLCEELLRISKDGILRCFMPYDCDKPRLRLDVKDILKLERIEGLFLGRFFLWEVHTLLRVFVFCSSDEDDRAEWLKVLQPFLSDQRAEVKWPIGGSAAALLTDQSWARRWRPSKRIVLNDRRLLHPQELAGKTQPKVADFVLDRALSFAEGEPSVPAVTEFIDATCQLKGMTFKNWTERELMCFWLNTYHCLLLHGRLLLGKPKSRIELGRFYNRVSYLVGVKPVSLKEIELYILRIPPADKTAVNYAGRARGRQLWACLCCRKRGPPQPVEPSSPSGRNSSKLTNGKKDPVSPKAKESKDLEKQADDSQDAIGDGFSEDSGDNRRDGNGKVIAASNRKCLPTPPVPNAAKMAQRFQPLFMHRRGPSASFFNGESPEPLGIPMKDMRAVLCLNRGNASCLSSIPLFCEQHLHEQMEEVCRAFCAEFVKVQEKDNVPTRATLPHCCRGLKRELTNDYQALLRFVWQFLANAKERGQPTRSTQLRFTKFRREPRSRRELKRFAYGNPKLVITPDFPKGPEFQALAGAAHALVKIVEHAQPDTNPQPEDVTIDDGLDTEGSQAPRPTLQKRDMKIRSLPQPVIMAL
jgi:hypothetical protein